MSTLTGTLDTFTAAEVLQLLERTGRSGALHLRADGTGEAGIIYCADGAVTFAGAHGTASPGDVLVRAGFLSGEDWQAAASRSDAAVAIAEKLVARGTDPEKLRDYVRHHTEEAVFELDQWTSGEFSFRIGDAHALTEAFNFPIAAVLEAVRERTAAWATLRDVIPSLDSIVDQAPSMAGDDGEIAMTRAQVRVLTMIDGRLSVRDLARELNEGIFQTCKILASLIEGGMVRLVEGSRRPAPAPSSASNGNGKTATNGAAAASKPEAALEGLPAVDFASGGGQGEKPDRDLVLRLLSAVKEL